MEHTLKNRVLAWILAVVMVAAFSSAMGTTAVSHAATGSTFEYQVLAGSSADGTHESISATYYYPNIAYTCTIPATASVIFTVSGLTESQTSGQVSASDIQIIKIGGYTEPANVLNEAIKTIEANKNFIYLDGTSEDNQYDISKGDASITVRLGSDISPWIVTDADFNWYTIKLGSIIKYNTGAETSISNQWKFPEQTAKISSVIPTKDGFTFMGWTTEEGSNHVDYAPGADYSVDEDLTLYAVWTPALTAKALKGATVTNALNKNVKTTVTASDVKKLYSLEGIQAGDDVDYDAEKAVYTIDGQEYQGATAAAQKLTALVQKAGNYPVAIKLVSKDTYGEDNGLLTGADASKYVISGVCTGAKVHAVKAILIAKATPKSKASTTLSWLNVQGAAKYVIYYHKCAYTNPVKYKTVKATTAKYVKTTLKGGVAYKYQVRAYNKSGKLIAKSYVCHSIANKLKSGGKYSEIIAVKVNKTAVSLKTGKTFKIKAKIKTYKNRKCLPKIHGAKYKYSSSDASVASVNSKGTITAKKSGKCYVYVQSKNGVYKKITVTVTPTVKDASTFTELGLQIETKPLYY